jgi:hypothetical protein
MAVEMNVIREPVCTLHLTPHATHWRQCYVYQRMKLWEKTYSQFTTRRHLSLFSMRVRVVYLVVFLMVLERLPAYEPF